MQTIKINPALTAIKTTVGGQSFATGDLFKNLLLWFPLTTEWANGTTVLDRGPKKLHTAVSGNPVIGANFTTFDGTGDWINVVDSVNNFFNFTNTGAFTTHVYIKTLTAGIGVFSRRSTYGWLSQIRLGKCDCFIDDVGGNKNTTNTITVNDGVWHSIMFVFDSSTNPMRRIFVDGEVDTIISGSATVGAFAQAGIDLRIGATNAGGSVLVGSLRDAMIWNMAKTQADARILTKQMQSLNLA